MYGYITERGVVGQLFEEMPEESSYHSSFRDRIVLIPDQALCGWLCDFESKSFSPPPEEPPAPIPDQDRDELIVDLEYRLTLVELGIV